MNDLAAARESLFADALACEEVRPAAFEAGAPDAARLAAHLARSEALLRALAVVEDSARHEDPDQPHDTALHRIEAKLDLLTSLVATLAGGHGSDPLRALKWSARGACLVVDAPVPAGTRGLFRVQPADWLPSPLVLPATVLACEAAAPEFAAHASAATGPVAWLRFDALPSPLEAALERQLFRLHRRAVAESRRPR